MQQRRYKCRSVSNDSLLIRYERRNVGHKHRNIGHKRRNVDDESRNVDNEPRNVGHECRNVGGKCLYCCYQQAINARIKATRYSRLIGKIRTLDLAWSIVINAPDSSKDSN